MVEKQIFDIAIIGAGPAGYVAAIKASQMGKKVVLIERKYLGGTCLNVGCIPSKTLLANAQVLRKVRRSEDYGITIDGISFDYSKMKARKDRVVEQIKSSLKSLIMSNKITIVHGDASFLSPNELKVRGEKNELIEAEKVIIATGSEPIDISAFPCDHQLICNSTSILELTTLPRSIAIIGGGYIGCEFASLFAAFGVKVTIIEALPHLVEAQGKILSEQITKAFIAQGITIKTQKSVENIETHKEGLFIELKDRERLESDMALVAVGRRLVSEGLGLERAGLVTTPRGAIEVNDKLETHVPGIYAIGDITSVAMLAHVASHQGMVAAMNACGEETHINYRAIPAVIFTHPEMATVGLTAEQAKEQGYQTSVGTYPFQALGKSIATDDTEGFAQVISDKKTGEILGAQVMGHAASVLIAEMALAINNELTLECVTETIHAHPTLAEAWLEATLLANQTPIHFPPKAKKPQQ